MMQDPTPDDLESFAERLRAQPPVKLPGHWRAEILAAAAVVAPPARWHRTVAMLAARLWPHPAAFAGLAVAWVLIVTMRLSTPVLTTVPIFSSSDSASTALAPLGNGMSIFASMRLADQESSLLPATKNRP